MDTNKKYLNLAASFLALAIIAGCQQNYNRMTLVNYADPEKPETLTQNFTQGDFADATGGGYEILLASREPIGLSGGKVLRQAVYVTTLWTPIPGKTYAELSQINATIIYLVEFEDQPGGVVISRAGPRTLCWKGSGFVSFYPDRTGEGLTGAIEEALLEPTHKKAGYRLGAFQLSGNFKATRNRAAVAEFKLTEGTYCR